LFLESSPFSSLSCKIHPVVVWSILDQFIRRPEGSNRVIGTLTGINYEGQIEIRSCFPVPHKIITRDDEATVLVDNEYYQNMLELHNKAHPKETIVGWYATGSEITDHTVLIHHDFYAPQVAGPLIHLTVDTDLRKQDRPLGLLALVSSAIGVDPTRALVTQFLPVPLEIITFEAERVGVDALMRARDSKHESAAPLLTDLSTLEISLSKLIEMLDEVSAHVKKIMNKEIPSDPRLGRSLTETIAALPKVDSGAFDKMFNNSLQDLLMAVYLANLTRAQLAISERLQAL